MDKKHEKAMLDLERLLKTQNFQSMEEAQEFINKNLVGQTIPEFDKEALTPEERAQDLVYQAVEEEDPVEADKLIFLAFLHDADCVEAFEYLGDVSGSPMAALMLYENGCRVAKKKLGATFFEENKGHFWGLHETRPFMRCKKNHAENLYLLGQKDPALSEFLELLELNPNDNQGVRNQAGIISLELNAFNLYENLYKAYNEDSTAFHLYNYALYLFLSQGDTEVAREALRKARHYNKHVVHLMNLKKPLPPLPGMYGFGDKNEAIYYCTLAKPIWQSKAGALDWVMNEYSGK